MKAELLAFCRREALIPGGAHITCALSGGADSTAMLHCLWSLREELGITLSAAHFNHRLRGEESERDEAFVRSLCAQWDIPLAVGGEDVETYAKTHKLGLEEAARQCRYAFLEGQAGLIATAHNADDNAETLLLHLLRGSGLRGLCGIPPKRGRIIRPLLSIPRREILAYLQAEGITWTEDSTNAGDSYRRNRLRHTVLPRLYEEQPQLHRQLERMTGLLRQEDAYLEEQAALLLQRNGDGWANAPLCQAPAVLRRRALRQLLRQCLPQDVSLCHIEALETLLQSAHPSGSCCLPHGLRAQCSYDVLQFSWENAPVFAECLLQIPGETPIVPLGLKIHCKIEKNFEKFSNTPFHFAVKCDMIEPYKILARPRRTGDALLGADGHHRSVKKQMIDRKIPRWERDQMPVLCYDGQVLAVAGLGVSANWAAEKGQPALIIQINKEESLYDSRY